MAEGMRTLKNLLALLLILTVFASVATLLPIYLAAVGLVLLNFLGII